MIIGTLVGLGWIAVLAWYLRQWTARAGHGSNSGSGCWSLMGQSRTTKRGLRHMTGTDSTAITRRHPWVAADIVALQRLWDSRVPVRDIAAQLGLPLTTVKNAARRYCIPRLPVYGKKDLRRAWSAEERGRLLQWWAEGLSTAVIAARLRRSPASVDAQITREGLWGQRRRRWTPEEDAWCLTWPAYRVAQKTGRSPSAVAHRRAALRRLRAEQEDAR